METLIVLVIGVIATVAVSHYYFRRTVSKRISVYLTLRNSVLAGIDAGVRDQLKFHFGKEEVTELYQLGFIVANDGERAVSNCIEPLSLRLPGHVKLLDTSVIHRNPKDLSVRAGQEVSQAGRVTLKWAFPLLNKGDFFVVKLLLSGTIEEKQLLFHILADDLPRTLSSTWLPPAATENTRGRVEWVGVISGAVLLTIAAACTYCGYLLTLTQPQLFPYPWSTFTPSWTSTPAVLVGAVGVFFLIILGCVLFVGMGFEGVFRRHPKFPLPPELRGAGYRLVSERLAADATELAVLEETTLRAKATFEDAKTAQRNV